jgi:phage tail-like protein
VAQRLPFRVNSHRFDPYRNFKFKIKWDNQYVAGLSKCSALRKTTEVTEWREAGDPSTSRKLPGKTTYEPITLEAGVTHDTAFEDWANLVNNFQGDAVMSLRNYRKDITIDVFNLSGQKVLSYTVYRCWVSEYQALPELDASGNAVMIQTIKLENEGWERDTAEEEPEER